MLTTALYLYKKVAIYPFISILNERGVVFPPQNGTIIYFFIATFSCVHFRLSCTGFLLFYLVLQWH